MVYHVADVKPLPILPGMIRVALFTFLVCLCSASASAQPQQTESANKPAIVSSIRPLTLIAQAIAGDRAEHATIIGLNDAAHHFTLSPGDRLQLETADILLWVGPPFEVELDEFFQRRQPDAELLTVLSIDGVTIHHLNDGSIDPHVWLDPDNARWVAGALAERLGVIDPARRPFYQQRLAAFSNSLEAVTVTTQARLAELAQQDFIVYHNAYQYYEKRFGLAHAMALVSNPEVAPGIRETLRVQNRIAEIQPVCVLLEPDFNPALLRTLLGGTTTREVIIDLLGYELADDHDNYIGLLNTVTDGFVQCLSTTTTLEGESHGQG